MEGPTDRRTDKRTTILLKLLRAAKNPEASIFGWLFGWLVVWLIVMLATVPILLWPIIDFSCSCRSEIGQQIFETISYKNK